MKIPIATYTRAMRIAAKYLMDDVQRAIVRVIIALPSDSGIGKAIARLAFIAEFSGHFYKDFFKEVFLQTCSTVHRPSGPDLKPLMAFPNLVALMMQYREGIIQPNQAVWNERAPSPVRDARRRRPRSLDLGESREGKWLDGQLESLGLAPFLARIIPRCEPVICKPVAFEPVVRESDLVPCEKVDYNIYGVPCGKVDYESDEVPPEEWGFPKQ